jgi:hypothetical protein
MYKDSPHEGFGWPRYCRSIVVSALAALAWQLAVGLDLTSAAGRFVLFGLTYVTERGLVELWKGYLREEDQSKYFIPMQLHVMGRVVKSRRVRFTVAAVLVALVIAVAWGLDALQRSTSLSPLTAVLLVGSVGGWLSAFGGAFKDAPIEGFETLKFFRSPLVALGWALVLALFTSHYLFIALAGLGYTVATIETYKTFLFPHKPRGKFAGRPILFPQLVRWRYRFAPLYAAIWLAVLANLGMALGESRLGLLGGAPNTCSASADAGATGPGLAP